MPGDSIRWAAWLAPSLYPFYALIEVGTGLWAATILVEQRGMPLSDAGGWVAMFFGAIMLGRIGVGFISVRVGNRRLNCLETYREQRDGHSCQTRQCKYPPLNTDTVGKIL